MAFASWSRRGLVALTAIGLTTVLATPAFAQSVEPQGYQPCTKNVRTIGLININDFHGRLATKAPDTAAFFASIDAEREQFGEDNSLLLSAGDNIGASLFASFIANDNPTIQVLNAANVRSTAVGNHEFDRGFTDLDGRVRDRAIFDHLGANVYDKDTRRPALQEYTIVKINNIKVAIVGVVTKHLPELVSPKALEGLTIGDPVEAVNRVAAQVTKGRQPEADLVIAEYHEGANTGASLDAALASSAEFATIVKNTSAKVDLIFNAHTHQTYAFQVPKPGMSATRPIVQAGSYGSHYAKVTMKVDGRTKKTCAATAEIKQPQAFASQKDRDGFVAKYPRATYIDTIVKEALNEADKIGAEQVVLTNAPITRALPGGKEDRGRESSMSDLVAQMFSEQLGPNNPEFIGIQNPGGTRADFAQGPVSYAQAAAVLPFANSLMTTQLSGAQVKTLLEQQWQPVGSSRPYLQLGLSSNVSYTYDETRPAGDRITSIMINGAPIDAAKTYTVGSGSFLIAGGDNFTVLGQGANTSDTGKSDLETWVDWLRNKRSISPDFSRQAVSVQGYPTTLAPGSTLTLKVGVAGANAKDSLDMTSYGYLVNTDLVASINGAEVAKATVAAGVATINVTIPAGATGKIDLVLTVTPSNTVITLPITVS